MPIEAGNVKITLRGIAGVVHEGNFILYRNALDEFREKTGASREVADAAIKEADRKIKDAFLEAFDKIDQDGAKQR